jgi:hypothetical protein
MRLAMMLSGGANDKNKAKVIAEIFEKDLPGVKEDEPTTQEIGEPLPKVKEVISHDKNFETNTTRKSLTSDATIL